MEKFRKKPVEIEAVLWTGQNDVEISQFLGRVVHICDLNGKPHVMIHTLEGAMSAAPGDWIIKGVKGEFHPCKPDIFAETYERI